MFIKTLTLVLFLLPPVSYANLHVNIIDKSISNKDVRRAVGYQVEIHSAVNAPAAVRLKTLPLLEQARIYKKAGLSPYIKKFDQFEKDMLFRSLHEGSVKGLYKRYRKIPRSKLYQAKKIVIRKLYARSK